MHYHFIDRKRSSSRCASAASCWNGPRCSATTTARRASRSRRRSRRPRRAVRHRLAGHAADCASMRATIWSASSCCRRRSAELGAAARTRAPRTATMSSAAACASAGEEISHWAEYDYVSSTTTSSRAFRRSARDPAAERLKRERQPGLSNFRRASLQSDLRRHERAGGIRARSARASATKPSTGISSARAVGSMPAAASSAQRIDAERLEALAQHLAALAEGGLGHALEQRARSQGSGVGARHELAPPTR